MLVLLSIWKNDEWFINYYFFIYHEIHSIWYFWKRYTNERRLEQSIHKRRRLKFAKQRKKIHSEDDVFVSVFELIKKKFDSMKRVKQVKFQKRTSTFVLIKRALNVNFEDETLFKRFKRNLKNRIVANVLIEMQSKKFNDFFKQFEFEQIQLQKQFDVETKQKDLHHKKMMIKQKKKIVVTKMQHEEITIRLRIKLKKTSQNKQN